MDAIRGQNRKFFENNGKKIFFIRVYSVYLPYQKKYFNNN